MLTRKTRRRIKMEDEEKIKELDLKIRALEERLENLSPKKGKVSGDPVVELG